MINVEETPRIALKELGGPLVDYLLYRRHLFAYEQALKRSSGREICLDVACGLGYALPALKKRFEAVIALDMANHALSNLPRNSAYLVQADARKVPVKSSSIDVVFAFQIIEHMSKSNGVKLIHEIHRVLKPSGIGFITTPNAKWRLLLGQRPWNPYHVHEYSPGDVANLSDKTGIRRENIRGVIGINGAQEIECARVKQSYLSVWGGRLGAGIQRRLRNISFLHHDNSGSRSSVMADDLKQWYRLSNNYKIGLDFWIEIKKF